MALRTHLITFAILFLFGLQINTILADSIYQNKSHAEIIQLATKRIKEEPKDSQAFLFRAYSLASLGKWQEALQDYREADAMQPNLDTKMGLQWVYLTLGNYRQSIAIGETLHKSFPRNYFILYRLAEANLGQGWYSEAKTLYERILEYHGDNAYITWKIGICDYYQGKLFSAHRSFEKANEQIPTEPLFLNSLNNTKLFPYFSLSLEGGSASFKGNDFIGNSNKSGLSFGFSPNSRWSAKGAVYREITENFNSTKGVSNYMLDPLSFAYYSYYQYTPSTLNIYVAQPLNSWNLYNLSSSPDYLTNRFQGSISYRFADKWYLSGSGTTLQSNFGILDKGGTGQVAITYQDKNTVSFATTRINHPTGRGNQASLTITLPFLDYFYSSHTITGQSMTIKENETLLVSVAPFSTTNVSEWNRKNFGFYMQEIGIQGENWGFGIGGRAGSSRTPMFGENWTYLGFVLKEGGFTSLSYKIQTFTVSLLYSRDYWLDSRNETSYSDSVKINLNSFF